MRVALLVCLLAVALCAAAAQTCTSGQGYAYRVGAIAATSCVACPAGYSLSATGQCLPCSTGYWNAAASTTATTCTACPAGQYGVVLAAGAAISAAAACTNCPAGTYSANAGSSVCTPCAAGYFSAAGATTCTICATATPTTNGTGSATCAACPAGNFVYSPTANGVGYCYPCGVSTFSTAANSATCTTCAAGMTTFPTATTGATVCVNCALGTYGGGVANTACTPASYGYYVNVTGNTVQYACPTNLPTTLNTSSVSVASCLACAAGNMVQVTGADGVGRCVACTAGTNQTAINMMSCDYCPTGFFSGAAATTCTAGTACPAGSYVYYTSSFNSLGGVCMLCPVNTFSAAANKLGSCDACATATPYSNTGATVCYSCAAGSYNGFAVNSTTTTACALCPAGSYSTAINSFCTGCPTGTASPSAGATVATACADCPAGTYAAGSAATCTPCAAGTWESGTRMSYCSFSCAAQTFGNMTGQTSAANCKPCQSAYPSGWYSNAGWGFCRPCPAGSYCLDSSSVNPYGCTSGTFNNLLAQNSTAACVPCAAGSFSYTASSSYFGPATCTSCWESASTGYGYFSTAASSTSCTQCATNAPFVVNSALTNQACAPCAQGTYSGAGTTANTCVACPTGTYNANTGVAACAACPAGWTTSVVFANTTVGATTVAACNVYYPFFQNGASAAAPQWFSMIAAVFVMLIAVLWK